MKYLIPEPHVNYSFMTRNKSWPQVFAELIDNAFDKDGGDAREVTIELNNDRVVISDTGRGVADVNMLAQLGSSGSYQHSGNLGQYGIGSKSWLCKANRLLVQTVRDGVAHSHAFKVGAMRRAFERGQAVKHHIRAYEGKGKPSTEKSFTRIELAGLIPSAGPIVVPALVADLERRFWPGLLAGRHITICDSRRKQKVISSLKPMAPPAWTDRIAFESSVNGRAYKATVGILTDGIGAYGGLFIGYLYRTVSVEKYLATRPLPSRVHGQIELSESWRGTLANYKDDIVRDKLALLADIEEKAATILVAADQYSENLRLDGIASDITVKLNDALRRTTIGEYAQKQGTDSRSTTKTERGRRTAEGKSRARRKPQQLVLVPTEPQVQPKVSGIRVEWEGLGNDLLGQVVLGETIVVKLNRDCRKLEAITRQPRYPGLYLAVGDEIAMACVEWPAFKIERYFGGILGASNGTQDSLAMARSIRVWFGFVVNEIEQQSQEAGA